MPSQLTNSLPFLVFSILVSAVYVPTFRWATRKTISELQQSQEFSDLEIAAVHNQFTAVLVEVPVVLLFFAVSPLIWDHPTAATVFIGLAIGFTPIAYIAVSSIQNRISIFRGRERLPVKGAKAIWSGVANLVLIFLVVTGYVLYFASGK
jgi:hypothetical protein